MTRAEIDAPLPTRRDRNAYDQPYEDKNTRPGQRAVHRREPVARTAIVVDRRRTARRPSRDGQKQPSARTDFATMILDNLRKAGVQNTVKNERLKFDRLDPFAGEWIHADGRLHRTGRQDRGASPCRIGPEYGTVGPQQVKEAAKEAVRGVGFDLLIVCGFAFDPHVSRGSQALRQAHRAAGADEPRPGDGRRTAEEDRRRQPVHGLRRARLDIKTRQDGKLVVEIKGVDVYDPTTGADPQLLDRRHRLLVHRHRLQRRELLRPPRLLLRRRRALRQAQARPARRDRRGRTGRPSTAPRATPSTRRSRARSP